MTFRELSSRLAHAGIPTPEVDARLLLAHFFDVSAAALYAFPERDYDAKVLEDAVLRRLAREPLQHILGEAFFFDERYAVSPDCLIPRADTELLVEEACARLPKGARFADFCTGSGCIALSVLLHREDTRAVAVDVSPRALAVAKKNAARMLLEERVDFFEADLLSDAPLPFPIPDCILSNPPYIPSDVIPTLAPEIAFEPALALDGGEDGLVFYRTLLSRFSPRLFLFEIGYDQGDAVSALGEAAGYTVTVRQDAGGCDRLVVLTRADGK
ncbi:MAG: peptide chain release factor N(5)-glutamine methyltransferase [Clostridia bacterium]|nr:peptide chain release factor N(5)-glutamine methyltransferase [Clostridia bacterium]